MTLHKKDDQMTTRVEIPAMTRMAKKIEEIRKNRQLTYLSEWLNMLVGGSQYRIAWTILANPSVKGSLKRKKLLPSVEEFEAWLLEL